MARRHTIVLATDDAAAHAVLSSLFQESAVWNCVSARTGAEALDAARSYGDAITVFFMDHRLLGADGWEAIRLLQTPATVDCPPVVLLKPADMALSDCVPEDQFISEAIDLPIDRRLAKRRLRILLDLHAYQKKDVTYQHQVSRDPLLGLLTGSALRRRAEEALAQSESHAGLLAYINMDATRAINERSGHSFGDRVLIDAARTIVDALPETAVIGRPHGDTFCAYVPGESISGETRLMETLHERLRRVYPDAPGGDQRISACIGVARAPENGADFLSLYHAAEQALAVAKGMGPDILLFYSPQMGAGDGAREQAHGQAQPAMLSSVLIPSLDSLTGGVIGYDYIPVPDGDGNDDTRVMLERMSQIPLDAAGQALRVGMKRFFYSIFDMDSDGEPLPRFSYYTALHARQADLLLQMLQESLALYPVDPSLICVHVSQQMVMEMTRGQLVALAAAVRALGFYFGLHGAGKGFIANACFEEKLFDRILFAPCFAQDLIDGVYPPTFARGVLQVLLDVGTHLCFPLQMTEGSRGALAAQLDGPFGYYGRALATREAYLAYAKASRVAAPPLKTHEEEPPALRIGNDRYNEILTRSGIILMDWRPHEGHVTFSESFSSAYGEIAGSSDLSIIMQGVVHPQDYDRLMDMLMEAKHGRSSAEGVFRVYRQEEGRVGYRWRRVFIFSVQQADGVTSHVYCITFDVDREQREMQSFKHRAETDPLTGLYNRGATEGRIRSILEGEGADGHHAMMIIDIDNFKSHNDRLGHISGDHALQYMAKQMKGLFRRGDVIGRIGGDEFMVFLENISSIEKTRSRAEDICAVARQSRISHPEWNLSCSIGVARFPADGEAFETLYAKADLALYRAKEEGRDRWHLSGDGEGELE